MNRRHEVVSPSRWRGLLAVTSLAALLSLPWFSNAGTSRSADLLSGTTVMDHIRYFASDELQGRGNGSDGLEQAARYIAVHFARLGLQPGGVDGTFFQPFKVNVDAVLGSGTKMSLVTGGRERSLHLHRDYEPMTFSAAGTVEGPVVFVGYGITAPELDYDDYAGVDVRGKIVLALRHVPREKSPAGPFEAEGEHATFVRKAANALAHEAAALVLVNDPLNHASQADVLLDFGENLGADALGIPSVHLRREWAERMLSASGRDLTALQSAIDASLKPASFDLPQTRMRLRVEIHRRQVAVRNVLGYLPPASGSGTEEFLVIGAHYDHLGLGDRSSRAREPYGQIHNGADDNASGTAGVLELARAFASARRDLSRGILFVAFAGEELGLQGSKYFVSNPTLPLENAVTMLNLDMIGRLRRDQLYVGGVDSSPLFRPVLETLAARDKLSVSFGFSGYGSSDHTSFVLQDIPALFFFTGLHGDYHKPTDDSDQIDVAGLERVLRLAYGVADAIQSSTSRPVFTAVQVARGGGGGLGPYLGGIIDTRYTGTGVRLNDVVAGGPAAMAGLLKGDVLVELDGHVLETVRDFVESMRARRPGDTVTIKVNRGDVSLEVPVTLGRRP